MHNARALAWIDPRPKQSSNKICRQTVSENIDGQMSVVSGSGYRRSQCSYLAHEVSVKSVTVTTRPHAPLDIVDHSAVSPVIVIVVVVPLGVINS